MYTVINASSARNSTALYPQLIATKFMQIRGQIVFTVVSVWNVKFEAKYLRNLTGPRQLMCGPRALVPCVGPVSGFQTADE